MRKCQFYEENLVYLAIFEHINFFNFRSTFWFGQVVPPPKKILATPQGNYSTQIEINFDY